MFEELCLFCQTPTTGSPYCSDDCKAKDKIEAEQQASPYIDNGLSSAASSRSALAPQEFASPFLSAVPSLVHSHRSTSGRASSSSASTTSSPATSPWTSASQGAVEPSTSPPALSLPPQAYPMAQPSPRLEPVKIPPAISRAPASLDGHSSRGDETLKYVRRPGATSHLTSPLALFPIANPTRKTFSGAHSNSGNSPRLSPMLSPLLAPVTKLPKSSQKLVRCDRPGCTLLHTALYGRSHFGSKTDGLPAFPRLDGEEPESPGPCHGHLHSEDEDERPSPQHTHSAFTVLPSASDVHFTPSGSRQRSDDGPSTRDRMLADAPVFARRASVPANHYSGSLGSSFPSDVSTPVSRISSDSSEHAVIRPSPLAQSPDVSSPDFGRRGRSRQRSQSGERRERGDSANASRGRETLGSRSRSRVRSPPRSRSRADEHSRGRRGESSRRGERGSDEREESTPRGRRGTSRLPDCDSERNDGEVDKDATSRGRPDSRRRSHPDIPMVDAAPVVPARSLSESPDNGHHRPSGIRGRRPTVVVKPAPFTALSSDGVIRKIGSSSNHSRDRERDQRAEEDARSRLRSMRVVEA